MPTITWLHLSDLHFRADDLHTWNEDVVLRSLLEDVQKQMSDGLSPDLILVSGDIAFGGAAAEYDLALAFFDDLLQTTGLPKERLFLVPGNHDVDRKRITFVAKIGPTLTSRDEVNAVLGESGARREFWARFEGYTAFLGGHFGHLSPDDEGCFCASHLDLAGCRVAVLGLNSAWLAQGGGEDRNRLALGERQVRRALDAAKGADVRLAVLHHPFDWLSDFDREDNEALLTRECDLILHGHLHRTGLTLQQTPDAKAMIVAAGASYESRRNRNSYNLVELDPETRSGTIYLRAWSDQGGGFWTKDVLSYRNVSDGVYRFSLADQEASGAAPPPKARRAPDPLVRPFIDAAEDLQSRLANLLWRGGLGALRRESPAGEYAGETVYRAARYFGWARLLGKSPYGSDEQVIALTDKIRDAFATDRYKAGAFQVFRSKQEASGQLVVRRPPGGAGTEYETMSLYEFQEGLTSPPLSTERWIQVSLAALKETRSMADLEGRERLVAIQDALVDLLEHLEEEEGYKVFQGKRKRAPAMLASGAAAGGAKGDPQPAGPQHAGSGQTVTAEGGSAAATGGGVAQTGSGNVAIIGPVQGGVSVVQGGARAAQPTTEEPGAPEDPGEYDLGAVRDLLLEAFPADDLRRFVLYTKNAELGLLSREFSESDGPAELVEKAIRFCQARALLPDLLREVEGENPRQYRLYAQRLRP